MCGCLCFLCVFFYTGECVRFCVCVFLCVCVCLCVSVRFYCVHATRLVCSTAQRTHIFSFSRSLCLSQSLTLTSTFSLSRTVGLLLGLSLSFLSTTLVLPPYLLSTPALTPLLSRPLSHCLLLCASLSLSLFPTLSLSRPLSFSCSDVYPPTSTLVLPTLQRLLFLLSNVYSSYSPTSTLVTLRRLPSNVYSRSPYSPYYSPYSPTSTLVTLRHSRTLRRLLSFSLWGGYDE